MRFERRAPSGLGMVYGGVLVLAAALALAWTALGLPLPDCLFRRFTGLACPTCGSTRLVEALLRGEVGAAFAANPLFFAGLSAVALWSIGSLAWACFGFRALHPVLERGPARAARIGSIVVFGGGWAYLIWRDLPL
jgi:hypothetical protein